MQAHELSDWRAQDDFEKKVKALTESTANQNRLKKQHEDGLTMNLLIADEVCRSFEGGMRTKNPLADFELYCQYKSWGNLKKQIPFNAQPETYKIVNATEAFAFCAYQSWVQGMNRKLSESVEYHIFEAYHATGPFEIKFIIDEQEELIQRNTDGFVLSPGGTYEIVPWKKHAIEVERYTQFIPRLVASATSVRHVCLAKNAEYSNEPCYIDEDEVEIKGTEQAPAYLPLAILRNCKGIHRGYPMQGLQWIVFDDEIEEQMDPALDFYDHATFTDEHKKFLRGAKAKNLLKTV